MDKITILQQSFDNLNKSFMTALGNNAAANGKLDGTANGLEIAGAAVEKNQADIDYIAMMTDVELPE